MKIKTGKVAPKRYKCQNCNTEIIANTNHYGEFYDICKNCSWKSPMDPIKTHVCLEPLPEGWEKPESWKKLKLGDICEFIPAYEDEGHHDFKLN